MEWIGWLIFVLVVLSLLGKLVSGQKKRGRNNNKPARNVAHEAQEIAKDVKTIQQFRALQKKLESAENRMSEVKSERAYDDTCHRHDVLQAALDIAQSKIYQWQFIPNVDLNTPREVLDHAYKVFSQEQYEQLRESLSNDKSDWHRIDGYGEREDEEPHIKSLIAFRSIVESGEPQENQIKKINQLTSRNTSFSKEFFDSDSDLKPGDQWFAERLRLAGLPLAHELYSEGYTTLEKCLEIDIKDFSKRKGVGPKKLEQIKEFQASVRANSNVA
jgi:hypothetical protein